MEKLVDSLLGSANSEAFREPVDWRGLGLHDYPIIIKRPMDLGTVKLRLQRGAYPTAEACAADVRLIWDNCRTYNTGGVPRDLHKAADTLSKRFEARFAKMPAGRWLKPSYSRGGGGGSASSHGNASARAKGSSAHNAAAGVADPTNEDRRRLARHLGCARMEDVTSAVHEIDERCPEALLLRRAEGWMQQGTGENSGARSSDRGDVCDGKGGGAVRSGGDNMEAFVGTAGAIEIDIDVDALDAWTFWAVERLVAPPAAIRTASRATVAKRTKTKRPAAGAEASCRGRSSDATGAAGVGEDGGGKRRDAAGAEGAGRLPCKKARHAC